METSALFYPYHRNTMNLCGSAKITSKRFVSLASISAVTPGRVVERRVSSSGNAGQEEERFAAFLNICSEMRHPDRLLYPVHADIRSCLDVPRPSHIYALSVVHS